MRRDWLADVVDEEVGEARRTGMNMPLVASAACWRKTVELEPVVDGDDEEGLEDGCLGVAVGLGSGRGSCRMSIGMARRWHAKMAFMMGMYWCARSVEGEAEISRIRD